MRCTDKLNMQMNKKLNKVNKKYKVLHWFAHDYITILHTGTFSQSGYVNTTSQSSDVSCLTFVELNQQTTRRLMDLEVKQSVWNYDSLAVV